MRKRIKKMAALLLSAIMTISVMPAVVSAEKVSGDGDIALTSLLPLNEVKAAIDLSDFMPVEISNIKVSDVLNHMVDYISGEPIEIDSNATTVWSNFSNENGQWVEGEWKVTNMDDVVNLSNYYNSSYSSARLQLIVGSGKQLDIENNTRYIINSITKPSATEEDIYVFDFREQQGEGASAVRKEVEKSYDVTFSKRDYETEDGEIIELPLATKSIPPHASMDGGSLYMSLSLNEEKYSGYELNVYNGYFKNAEEAAAAAVSDSSVDITAKITGQEMDNADAGYKLKWMGQRFPITVVVKKNGSIIGCNNMLISISRRKNQVYPYGLFTLDENSEKEDVVYSYFEPEEEEESSDITNLIYELYWGCPADSEYWFGMSYYDGNTDAYDNSKITKAVVGHYNSLEEAADQPDIKDKLFTEDDFYEAADKGYKANFAGDGIDFTVFADGESWKYTVKAIDNNGSPYIGDMGLYTQDYAGDREKVNFSRERTSDKENNVQILTYKLLEGYSENAEYWFGMRVSDYMVRKHITKTVVGHYNSVEEAAALPDITDQLIPEGDYYDNMYNSNAGYKANFGGNGVNFTIFIGNLALKYTVKAIKNTDPEPTLEPEIKTPIDEEPPIVGSSDKYFNIRGMYDSEGNQLDSYIIPPEHDTYYSNGYQAILINDENVDLTALSPYIFLADKAKVYYDGVAEKTENNYNILSSRDFSAVPSDLTMDPRNSVKYTVSSEDHLGQKNYNVSVAKKTTGGAQLFVNGPDEREILLDDFYGNMHEIFIANIGNEPLTNISVVLTDAKNVKLDEYWQVGGEKNNTLAPFTTTSKGSGYSELPNVAKIRLLPDGNGQISGKLTITADGQEPRVITLKGTAGNPKIDTESLHDAVKYVPYQSIITTNNMHDWNKVTFSLDSGTLPEGVELMPSGELYGVPKKSGTFKFKVRADYSYKSFKDSIVEFTLNVLDNSDENVNAQTDEGYEIIKAVPSIVRSDTDQVFEFEYDYADHKDEFRGFWLDGEKLDVDTDYSVDPGSTKITIKSQTIKNAGSGKHTIAAEYRSSSTNEVKKAAQNYTRKNSTSSGGFKPSGSVGGGGGGSSSPSTYKVWFEVNGGAWLQELTVKRGETADIPTPERAGYAFGGWYTDEGLTKPYDTKAAVYNTVVLYAKWIKLYKVSFNENEGSQVDDIIVQDGNKVESLPTTTRSGYIFEGWYKDEAFTQLYDINETVTQDITLNAKWTLDKPPLYAAGFRDINQNDWFYDDIDWAYKQGLMIGVSNFTFEPNSYVTGGMVVAILARLTNEDIGVYNNRAYATVYEGEWYTPYAKWAKAIGLVDDIPFNPPVEITREKVGVILVKYLSHIGYKYQESGKTIRFADEDEISADAKESLKTLYELGILKGRENNKIDPSSFTTRAEFAALMNRLAKLTEK